MMNTHLSIASLKQNKKYPLSNQKQALLSYIYMIYRLKHWNEQQHN